MQEEKFNKQDGNFDQPIVSRSREWGSRIKYKFISPKTSERHIKEFELPSDAYYWGMMNLDLSMEWQAVPYYG